MDAPTDFSPAPQHLSLHEIGVLLVKHFGYHEGQFDVSVEMGFGAGAMDFPGRGRFPGAMVGFVGIGLVPSTGTGSVTIDASKENPAPVASPRKTPSAKRPARRTSE
jgi:hypothetical protein